MSPQDYVFVLVVEDDQQMRALLTRGLKEAGYAVVAAADGYQALRAFDQVIPAVAVVDVMLPGMSGFELCTLLKEKYPDILILILTARDDIDDRVTGLDSGADDYLTKPFAFRELTARLRALIRRRATSLPTTLTADNIVMSIFDRIVTVDEEQLHLSPKEFSLLQLLMTHLNEVVTREAILLELWDTTENIDTNVVDQYIAYLRRKLDGVTTAVRIQTERGKGFRLQVTK